MMILPARSLVVRLKCALCVVTLLAVSAGVANAALGGGPREVTVLELSGTAYERGLTHGKRLHAEIGRVVVLWKQDLAEQAKMDPDTLVKNFLADTNYVPAIKKWTPDLLEEVRGIADGAGVPFDTMLAFQLVDEVWVYLDRPVAKVSLDRAAANHCTSMGIIKAGAHPAYVAQNMDLEAFRDGYQVVLHIAATRTLPEQFVFTCAGLVGVNGVNNHSIAIACNTLLQLTACTDGLPVAFLLRGVLAQSSPEAAVKFMKEVKHASGQNYVLGTRDRVFDFEASAGKVVEFRPATDGGFVYHTNHPLANGDIKPWHAEEVALSARNGKPDGDSEVRLAAAQARIRPPVSALNVETIKATLRSRDSSVYPVCRSVRASDRISTFGATIMTLSDTPSLEVSMGPPDVNPFVLLKFREVPR